MNLFILLAKYYIHTFKLDNKTPHFLKDVEHQINIRLRYVKFCMYLCD